jgi:hypothetical protein
MWTLIVKKTDNSIAGYMSTVTTRDNLGDYPEADYDLKYIEDSLIPSGPILGAIVAPNKGGLITITPSVAMPAKSQPDWKELYELAKTDSERIAIIAQKLGLKISRHSTISGRV